MACYYRAGLLVEVAKQLELLAYEINRRSGADVHLGALAVQNQLFAPGLPIATLLGLKQLAHPLGDHGSTEQKVRTTHALRLSVENGWVIPGQGSHYPHQQASVVWK